METAFVTEHRQKGMWGSLSAHELCNCGLLLLPLKKKAKPLALTSDGCKEKDPPRPNTHTPSSRPVIPEQLILTGVTGGRDPKQRRRRERWNFQKAVSSDGVEKKKLPKVEIAQMFIR